MDGSDVLLVIVLLLSGVGYALPTFIALYKNHPHTVWIMICNAMSNISFKEIGIGWVICLIWALSYKSVEKER